MINFAAINDSMTMQAAQAVSELDIPNVNVAYFGQDKVHAKYIDIIRYMSGVSIVDVNDYRYLMRDAAIKFTYSNCNVSNLGINQRSVKDCFVDGKLNGFTGDAVSASILMNHKMLFDVIYQDLILGTKVDATMVLAYHGILMASAYIGDLWDAWERPGTYLVNRTPMGRDIAAEVNQLINEYWYALSGTCSIVDILEAICIFYIKFLAITPFARGTDLMARFMMNYMLMSNRLPMTSLNWSCNDAYFSAMNAYYERGSIYEFIRFVEEQTVNLWITDN